jgi:signal transduction histidine kinase
VAQRTAELHEVIAGLESFNRSVSHDLRGPLGGIAGVSRLAREALGRGDTDGAARYLEAIAAQAEASSQLVGSLLALARVSEVDLAPQPLDLDRFVRETLEQIRLAEPAGARLPVTLNPLPRVHADPQLLRQVYLNLVGNALKFSREAASPQVELGACEQDGEQVLYVRDNGVGFDAERADGLFEPFRRLHGAQRFQGSGVGLSIVKRIVERHGGRVWAQSRPDAGATFFFSLGAR